MNEEHTGTTEAPAPDNQLQNKKDEGKAGKEEKSNTSPKDLKESKYLPIFLSWKWAIPILIGLFLIAGIIMICVTSQNFSLYYPSNGRLYLMTLHSIILVVVSICLCVAILKLLAIYAKNMEREREILANLYMEEQQRLIVRFDKEKDAVSDLKKANDMITKLEEKIEYLEKINKQLLEKDIIIK